MHIRPKASAVKGVKAHHGYPHFRRPLHVGLPVSKPETAKFYVDVLAFREFWRRLTHPAGRQSGTLPTLKSRQGTIKFRMHCPGVPWQRGDRRKGPYHIALEVPTWPRRRGNQAKPLKS